MVQCQNILKGICSSDFQRREADSSLISNGREIQSSEPDSPSLGGGGAVLDGIEPRFCKLISQSKKHDWFSQTKNYFLFLLDYFTTLIILINYGQDDNYNP